MPDMELINKTMQHIVDHPELHDQSVVWMDYVPKSACGTPGCFVGWAMYFDGYKNYDDWCERTGATMVTDWAAERLGISDHDATTIFYSANSIETLQLMVKDIANTGHVRDGGVFAYSQHQIELEEERRLAMAELETSFTVGAAD